MNEKKLPSDIIRRKVRILQKGVKIHGGNTRRAVIEEKPIPILVPIGENWYTKCVSETIGEGRELYELYST